MSGDETVTRQELAAFCVRHKDYGAPAADAIWDDIKAHREPEYEAGEIYESNSGHRYLRMQPGSTLPWLLIHRTGDAVGRIEDIPVRPLRKLVPEGSPVAVSREQVLQVLHPFNLFSNVRAQIADRIMKLLDGAQ